MKRISNLLIGITLLLTIQEANAQKKRSLKYYNGLGLEITNCPENLDSFKTYFNAYFEEQFVKNADYGNWTYFDLSYRHLKPLPLLQTGLVLIPLPPRDTTEEYPFTKTVYLDQGGSGNRFREMPLKAKGYMKYAQKFFNHPNPGALFNYYVMNVVNDGAARKEEELFLKALESGFYAREHEALPEGEEGPDEKEKSKQVFIDSINHFANTSFKTNIRYDALADTLEKLTGLSEIDILDTLYFQEATGKYRRLKQMFGAERFNNITQSLSHSTKIDNIPFLFAVPRYMLDSLESQEEVDQSDDSLMYFNIEKTFVKVKPKYQSYYVSMSLLGQFIPKDTKEVEIEDKKISKYSGLSIINVIMTEDKMFLYYKKGNGYGYKKMYEGHTFVR